MLFQEQCIKKNSIVSLNAISTLIIWQVKLQEFNCLKLNFHFVLVKTLLQYIISFKILVGTFLLTILYSKCFSVPMRLSLPQSMVCINYAGPQKSWCLLNRGYWCFYQNNRFTSTLFSSADCFYLDMAH